MPDPISQPTPSTNTCSPSTGKQLREFCVPILLGILPIAAVLLWKTGWGGMLFGSDWLLNFYYVRGMIAERLAEGNLPFWDAHTLCGFPHIAAMQGAVFYPPSWIFRLVGTGWGWTLTVLLHTLLAFLFTYGWLRRGCGFTTLASIAGAWAFACSGYAFTHTYAGHITMVSAIPWTPAILWALESMVRKSNRRAWTGFILALVMQILAGYPMLCFFSALLVAARLAYAWGEHRSATKTNIGRSFWIILAAITAALLCAPQLLATLELVQHTQRSSGAGLEFATSYSLPPENLLCFLFPFLLGDGMQAPYWGRWFFWEVYPYAGVIVLLAACIGLSSARKDRRLWLGILTFALLMALGRYGPLFSWAYHWIPGVSLFRAPGRYLYIVAIAMSWLCACGIDRLYIEVSTEQKTLFTRYTWRLFAAAAIVFGLWLSMKEELGGLSTPWKHLVMMALQLGDRGSPIRLDEAFLTSTYEMARQSVLITALIFTGLGALFTLSTWKTTMRRHLPLVLVLGICVELLAFHARYWQAQPEENQYWPEELTTILKKEAGTYRICSVGDSRDIGRAQLYGVDHAGGNDPLLLARYAELLNASVGKPPEEKLIVTEATLPPPLRRVLGIRYCVTQRRHRAPPGYKRIHNSPGFTLYEDKSVLPRAFFVPEARIFHDRNERLRFLASPAFNPQMQVILEESIPVVGTITQKNATDIPVTITEHGNGHYTLKVNAEQGGYIVLAENWYPGWHVRIDNQNTDLLRANHMMMAVAIPTGPHTITFEYTPTWKWLSAFCVCIGFGLMILVSCVFQLRISYAKWNACQTEPAISNDIKKHTPEA